MCYVAALRTSRGDWIEEVRRGGRWEKLLKTEIAERRGDYLSGADENFSSFSVDLQYYIYYYFTLRHRASLDVPRQDLDIRS